jgi:hypothetical protein
MFFLQSTDIVVEMALSLASIGIFLAQRYHRTRKGHLLARRHLLAKQILSWDLRLTKV